MILIDLKEIFQLHIDWDFKTENKKIVKADIGFRYSPIPVGTFTKKQGSWYIMIDRFITSINNIKFFWEYH
ncbi:hypothetical protein BFL38_13865 [Brachyspira hampsonii]|uniref:Uncharacterized protein n=1 Tax=Brachyspira hampsonii TaxID=1287055 RepID=A0A1E5NGV1_9SPIR|nr:hypothetical protein BFL38_13865 [Brachyspira hampsonii]